jgi:hypothetical protein
MSEEQDTPRPETAPDPQTQREIEEFLNESKISDGVAEREAQEKEADTPAQQFNPEVPFGVPTEEDLAMDQAMYLPDIPNPTDEQKEAYIKAVLADEPFEWTLDSMDGRMQIKFRSRCQRVQTDIIRNLKIAMRLGEIPEDNPLVNLAFVQYFNLLHSVISVNGKALVSDTAPESTHYLPDVPEGVSNEDLREDANYRWYMESARHRLLNMQQIRLNHIINQAKLFEGLCAKLATEITKPNFSDPQGEQH